MPGCPIPTEQSLAALCQSCISVWVKLSWAMAIVLTDIWEFGEGEEEHTGKDPPPFFQEWGKIPDSRLGAAAGWCPSLPRAVKCRGSKQPQSKQTQAPACKCSRRQKDLSEGRGAGHVRLTPPCVEHASATTHGVMQTTQGRVY